ncbi:OmpP1/FadL family transporter [Methyloradius palustris]|uniref:Long-chain fatty acid transporter n=1 Tax=Methyloradius palustris TaxID=2778876 RepID=A0A8D5G6Y1_9PROT|nr:outer membrane protein transport protein [Methyloradius palustris]BCM24381.1 long-chain fatty acid transporter [Methyloradius palustris]
MKFHYKLLTLATLLAGSQAHATDGYFAPGYGVKSQGAGGVGYALPQDTLTVATNPAGLAWIGDRIDIGATWFRPIRESEITGSPAPGFNGTYDANDQKNFIIPEFGYSKQVSPQLSLGVAVYGNGGMNANYDRAVPLLGSSPAKIDFVQVFVAPTIAWKITPTQSLGVTLNLAYQRFAAKGLENFANPSSQSPNDVTNKGFDQSYGAGLHVGWLGQFGDYVSLGASYQTKTYTSKFDKYKGLFAEQGSFDVPATFGAGIAVKATPALTIAGDVQRIQYSDVDSVGNSLANFFTGNQLGSNNGPGFGWKDVTVYKLGAIYAYDDKLTLRAGYNHSDQPIPNSETLFNILAPAVVQNHLTFGSTWKFENKSELSFSYLHAFENTVNGSGSIPGLFGGGEVNLKMRQDSVGVAYGWAL